MVKAKNKVTLWYWAIMGVCGGAVSVIPLSLSTQPAILPARLS
jgi:hypothetical protein